MPLTPLRWPPNRPGTWLSSGASLAPVTEYKLEMSSSSAEVEGEETEETIVAAMEGKFANVYQGPLTCYDLKTLIQPHHWYAFRVQAANAAGCSAYSRAATTRTPAAPPSAPAAPKGEATPTSVRLRWQRPNDNGAPVTRYNVELGDRTIATEGPVTELTVDGSVLRLGEDLHPASAPLPSQVGVLGGRSQLPEAEVGRGPKRRLRPVHGRDGEPAHQGVPVRLQGYRARLQVGNFSDVYQFSTILAPPAAVKMPKATEVERTACTLEWLPAKNPFADPVVYLVLLARGKEQTFKTVHRTHESKHQLEHLDAGTEYHARIVPVRLSGETELPGPPSPSVTFTTLASTELSSTTTATSTASAAQWYRRSRWSGCVSFH
ncbi:unnamed protein product [Callosobruchus maculatus]|uniref:Fibronectin type-III domain-containing protein n=1 Tax=Callosobruchus maculatus TaxID=64391 RepID=A0A653DTS0_CALMS|nr:unnamed protein product [Callosobruchus maculatus]